MLKKHTTKPGIWEWCLIAYMISLTAEEIRQVCALIFSTFISTKAKMNSVNDIILIIKYKQQYGPCISIVVWVFINSLKTKIELLQNQSETIYWQNHINKNTRHV